MTWISIGALAIGCYFFKAVGVFAGRHIRLSGVRGHALSNLTPAVLSGLIMVQTFDGGGTLAIGAVTAGVVAGCLLYTSPSPRDRTRSRMPSSA